MDQPRAPAGLSLIDCDVHNYPSTVDELLPFLPARWRAYVEQSGFTEPWISSYPKMFKAAARRDAWPPSGKNPEGDEPYARQRLLDEWSVDYGVLNPLYVVGNVHNLDFASALMRAVNDWTVAEWLDADPRWRASILVNEQDPAASAEEIRRCARDPRFVQVLLLVRSHAPFGRRQFHPLFAAARDAGLPIGIHFGGSGAPITACGWPSYYLEDHTGMAQAFQTQVISLVCEGVFEHFPGTQVALVEGGFAWLPSLMWRLDKNYKGLRAEVPWLKKLPSEYILDGFRATTQPMEEPPNPKHLLDLFDMIGRDDFLMFATDYPHWDFDSPRDALPPILDGELKRRILVDNAWSFYDFERT